MELVFFSLLLLYCFLFVVIGTIKVQSNNTLLFVDQFWKAAVPFWWNKSTQHCGSSWILYLMNQLHYLPTAVYSTEDWELHFKELAFYFQMHCCSSKWWNRSKSSRGNLATPFFLYIPLVFPPSFLSPAFLSSSLLVFQPSVIRRQSLLHQRAWISK